MKKETYKTVINDAPMRYDVFEVGIYLSGIYSMAAEDGDITIDDMMDIFDAGNKVIASVLGIEVDE